MQRSSVPRSQKGTWNVFWCHHKNGHDQGKMTKYDEPGPHWCDCTSDGRWKDSTLSSPKNDDSGWNHPCQCHGGLR